LKIKFPCLNDKDVFSEDKHTIVLVGGNGSGKTRLSVWIEKNNPEINIHRISAQKSLNMPNMVQPSDMETSQENLLYGISHKDKGWQKTAGKMNRRWQEKPETALLNDYPALMQYLFTEEYEKSLEFRSNHKNGEKNFDNVTKLELIKKLWEEILIHRKLKIVPGKIEVYKNNVTGTEMYNGAEMSDGERAIFYFIGAALSVPENSLIIIDEPENHLHKSLLTRLWNKIENYRPDCVFLYITHSIEFALSRVSAEIIWVKDFICENKWDYELLSSELPENLNLELLGNRDRVLFVEGTVSKSIDFKLYSLLFDDYNVIPLESCTSVIQFTKAYNGSAKLHYLDVKGIVDRDRRSKSEIEKLRTLNIFTPEVAEIESIFLLPNIIKHAMKVLQYDDVDINATIDLVQSKAFEFLDKVKEQQAILFMKQKLINTMGEIVNNKTESIDDYKTKFESDVALIDIQSSYDAFLKEMEQIISEKSFDKLLKLTNNKGLLPESGLLSKIKFKKDDYIDLVLRAIRNPENNHIRQEILEYIAIT
jgi:ABC-type cobalamin/Fe3+-siderophores transport system ATPase subunit